LLCPRPLVAVEAPVTNRLPDALVAACPVQELSHGGRAAFEAGRSQGASAGLAAPSPSRPVSRISKRPGRHARALIGLDAARALLTLVPNLLYAVLSGQSPLKRGQF
jgi:hypothetical protein